MDDKPTYMAEEQEKGSPGTSEFNDKGDHGAETELRRILSTRHVTMIALGSSIGMGLWLGSGGSLSKGGPAAIFIGYCLAGSMIWSVNHSIGEMAVMYPLPSAFVQWTEKFVSPAAAFALGWGYWFAYVIAIANELQVRWSVLSKPSLTGSGRRHYTRLLDRQSAYGGMDIHILARHHRRQHRRRDAVR